MGLRSLTGELRRGADRFSRRAVRLAEDADGVGARVELERRVVHDQAAEDAVEAVLELGDGLERRQVLVAGGDGGLGELRLHEVQAQLDVDRVAEDVDERLGEQLRDLVLLRLELLGALHGDRDQQVGSAEVLDVGGVVVDHDVARLERQLLGREDLREQLLGHRGDGLDGDLVVGRRGEFDADDVQHGMMALR